MAIAVLVLTVAIWTGVVGCADDEELTDYCEDHSDCDEGWFCLDICLPADDAESFLTVSQLDDEEIDSVCQDIERRWHRLSPEQHDLFVCSVDAYFEGRQELEDGNDGVEACKDYRQGCQALNPPDEWSCLAKRLTDAQRQGCHSELYYYRACEQEIFDGYSVMAQQFVCEELEPDGSLDDASLDQARRNMSGFGYACQQFFDGCPLE